MRVVGHLKSFKENSRSLIAFHLCPVTDFNEITYHMLDVIHSHLQLSKVNCSCNLYCLDLPAQLQVQYPLCMGR